MAGETGAPPSDSTAQPSVKYNRDGTPCRLVKRSKIWEIFGIVRDDPSKAVCSECNGIISRGGGTGKSQCTTNLWKHLQNKHHEIFKSISKFKEAVSRSERTPKDFSRFQHPENSKAWELFSVNVNDPTKIICLECDVEINRPTDNAATEVLWSHITAQHPVLYEKCVKEALECVVLSQKGKRSSVWTEFTQHPLDYCKVICNTCDTVVSRGNSRDRLNTTNMRRHLMGSVHIKAMHAKGLFPKLEINQKEPRDSDMPDDLRQEIQSPFDNNCYARSYTNVVSITDSEDIFNGAADTQDDTVAVKLEDAESMLARRTVDLFHSGLLGCALYEQQKRGICCDFSIQVQRKNRFPFSSKNSDCEDFDHHRCDDIEEYKIHRCVASIVSKRMRLAIESGSDKLTLKDTDKDVIAYFIEIIYTGRMELINSIAKTKLQDIFDLADVLSTDAVTQYLRKSHPNIRFRYTPDQADMEKSSRSIEPVSSSTDKKKSIADTNDICPKIVDANHTKAGPSENVEVPRINKRKNYIPMSNGNDAKFSKIDYAESVDDTQSDES